MSDAAAKDDAYDEAWSETIDYLTKYKIIDDANAKYYRRVFEAHDTDKINMLNEDQARDSIALYFVLMFNSLLLLVSIGNQGCSAQKPSHTSPVQLHLDTP